MHEPFFDGRASVQRQFLAVTDEELAHHDRLIDLVLHRAGACADFGGDPAEECERIWANGLDRGNASVAAAAAIVLANLILFGRANGYDVVSPEEISDRWLAEAVDRRMKIEGGGTVSVADASAIIGCTPQHIRRLARRGHIQGRRTPDGSWRCNAASVVNYRRGS
jgi:hypothetical protein